MTLPRVCVIGAGASGITATKVLHERGFEVDTYEMSDRVGGNWVWGNANGVSASYRSLHINTSRTRMAFSDFPMPDDLPDFPRHDHIAAYFEAYVEKFGFRDRIRFGSTVEDVAPTDDGFDVVVNGDHRSYDAVLVANGHHWDARWPDPPYPGVFDGEQMHAHDYKDEAQLAGKRVLVVGMGNSAMDIAVDASYHATRTFLSARRGAHVIPKYLFGKPFDQLGAANALPLGLRMASARALFRLVTGPMERYGLPTPDHRFGQAHPTVSSRILDRLSHGAISPKAAIERFDGQDAVFTDGSREQVDLVVWCTGYRITFPFLAPEVVDPRDNELRLYLRLFHPELDGLSFIGFVQPLGAIMPISERQAQLVADQLSGRFRLPRPDQRAREIAAYRATEAKRYIASKRHTIQVDFEDYMKLLGRHLGSR